MKPQFRRMSALVSLTILNLMVSHRLLATTPYQDYLIQSPELKKPEAGYQVGNFGKYAPNASELSSGFFSYTLGLAFDEQRGPLQITAAPSYNPGNGASPFGFGFTLDTSIHRYRLQGSLAFDNSDLWQSPWGVLSKGDDGYYYPQGLLKKIRIAIKDKEAIAWLDNRQTWTFNLSEDVAGGTYGFHVTKVVDHLGHQTLVDYEKTDGGYILPKSIRYGGRRADQLPYLVEFVSEALPGDLTAIDFVRGDTRILDRRIASIAFSSQGRLRYRYRFEFQSSDFATTFLLKSVQKVFASGEKDPAQILEYGEMAKPDRQYAAYRGLDELASRYGNAFLQGDSVSLYDYNHDGLQDIEIAQDYRVYVQTADGFKEAKQFADNGSPCFPKSGLQHLGRKVLPLQGYRSPLQVVLTNRESSINDFSITSCSLEGEVLYKTRVAMNLTPDSFLRWVDLNRDGKVDLVRLEGQNIRILQNISTATSLEFKELPLVQLPLSFRPDSIWFADANGDGIVDLLAQGGQAMSVILGYRDFDFIGEALTMNVFDVNNRPFSLNGYSAEIVDINGDGLGDLSLAKGVDRFLFRNTGRSFKGLELPARAGVTNETESQLFEAGDGRTIILKMDGKGSALQLTVSRRGQNFVKSWDDGRGTLLKFEYGILVGKAGQENPYSFLAALTKTSVGSGMRRTEYSVEFPHLHSEVPMLLGFGQVVAADKMSRSTLKFLHQDTYSGILLENLIEDLKIPGLQKKTINIYADGLFQGIHWPQANEIQEHVSRDHGVMTERSTYSDYDAKLCSRREVSFYQQESLQKDFEFWSSGEDDPFMSCLPQAVVMKGQHGRMDLNFIHRLEIERTSNSDTRKIELVESGNPQSRMLVQSISYDSLGRAEAFESMDGLKQTLGYEGESDLLNSVRTSYGLKEVVKGRDLFDQISQFAVYQDTAKPWIYSYATDSRERLSASWDSGFGSESRPLMKFAYTDPTPIRVGSIAYSEYRPNLKGTHEWQNFYSAAGEKVANLEIIGSNLVANEVKSIVDADNVIATFAPQVPKGASYESLDFARPISRTEGATVFDDFQGLAKVDSNSSRSRAYDYSVDGAINKTETTNGLYSKTWRLNSRDEIVAFIDEEKHTTIYVHDALGRLREITLPDGKKHTMSLDAFGRVQKIQRSGVGSVEYTFNQRSLIQDKTYFDTAGNIDRTSHHEYDSHGRKVLDVYAKGPQVETFKFFYDGQTFDGRVLPGQIGKLTQVQGDAFVKTWIYDGKGRLSEHGQNIVLAKGSVIRTLNYAYDESDRLTGQNLQLQNGSFKLNYSLENVYDLTGRQQKLTLNQQDLLIFGYNSLGRLGSIQAENSNISFDFDEVTQKANGFKFEDFGFGKSPATYHLDWDDRGFVGAEVYGQGSRSDTRTYVYSARGFLENAKINGSGIKYRYDANGTMLSIDDGNGHREFSREPQTAIEIGRHRIVSDAMSRITQHGEASFSFGPRGVVSKSQIGQMSAEYRFDEVGDILVTQVADDAVHFGKDLYRDGKYLQALMQGDQLIGWLENGIFKSAISDFRGTPLFTDDATLSIDPFGGGAMQGISSESLYFAGHGADPVSGLVRMGARQYHSGLASFLTADPLYFESPDECLKSPVECGLYSYAGNRPLDFVDPDGKDSRVMVTSEVVSDKNKDKNGRLYTTYKMEVYNNTEKWYNKVLDFFGLRSPDLELAVSRDAWHPGTREGKTGVVSGEGKITESDRPKGKQGKWLLLTGKGDKSGHLGDRDAISIHPGSPINSEGCITLGAKENLTKLRDNLEGDLKKNKVDFVLEKYQPQAKP